MEQVRLELTKTLGDKSFPTEYAEYIFCKTFGITPEELDRMDGHRYRLWLGFLNAEGEAQEMQKYQV